MGQRADRDEVDAGLGDRADVVERDAARGLELGPPADERDRLARAGPGVMLSSRIRSAPAASASSHLLERLALDLDLGAGVLQRSSTAAPIRPATRRWLSLIEDPVVEPEAVVPAASAAHRVLLERAQSGRRLARVEDLRAGAVDRVDVAAREGGDAREAAEQVERQALAARAARGRGPRVARSRPRSASPSAVDRLERGRSGRARRRRRRATSSPQTTPRLLQAGSAPRHVASSGTSASLVRSPAPRSSASQARTSTAVSSMVRRPARRRDGGRCAGRRGRDPRAENRRGSGRRGSRGGRARSARPGDATGCAERLSRSSPAPSRTRPASAHMAVRSSGVTACAGPWRLAAGRDRRGSAGSASGREGRPPAEDEALEHRVRGEPVRAVNAGAGALAGGIQARQLSSPFEIGDDPAHRVVGSGSDGDRLALRADSPRRRAGSSGRGSGASTGRRSSSATSRAPIARATTSRGASSSVNRSPSSSTSSAPAPRSASLRSRLVPASAVGWN